MKKSIILVTSSLILITYLGVGCEKGSKKAPNGLADKLNIFCWAIILGDKAIPNYEAAHKVKITYDTHSSNEELLAKIQRGNPGYDLVFPSDYMTEILIKQNKLQELDWTNIPNYKHIASKFKNLPFDPNHKYSIPFQYSTAGLGIDTSKVKNFKPSWDLLFDPKYKGQITMLDDSRYGLAPALIKLGFSINTTNPQELEKAKSLMLQQKPLVKAYTSDTYIDMLKAGEVSIVYGYSGDIFQIAKANPHVIYVIPTEGSTVAIESMCILKGAPHKVTAEHFMNYMLEPETHGEITNTTMYGNPNEAAKTFIKPAILNQKTIFFSDEVMNKCQFIKDVGKGTMLYDKVWTEIKSN